MLFNRALLYTTVLLATTVFAAPAPVARDIAAFSPMQVGSRSLHRVDLCTDKSLSGPPR